MKDGIDQIVHNAWNSFNRYGAPYVYLAYKLKHLKEEIRKWKNFEHKKKSQELLKLKDSIRKLENEAQSPLVSKGELLLSRKGL